MSTVIKVENLSKQYRLGTVGSGTFKEDVRKWWVALRGKENPYILEGEENNRTTKGVSDFVWSLKDINFEVEQGDVLGIIGKNGAGKSTLLKILSKVTSPTTGTVKAKGRIASLLEVGTGFHPELTGRENIYLNGAILGMRKHEISRKLDEIIAFAGVERYIDTPVKRYSSGMYVRLAFAVAAHLENEILIIDEVLAVGDAEFQKKCIAKMSEISKGEGRTLLFVSHNISSIRTLCNKGILLNNGCIEISSVIDEVITNYYKNENINLLNNKNIDTFKKVRIENVDVNQIKILNLHNQEVNSLFFLQNFKVVFEVTSKIIYENVVITLIINNEFGEKVFSYYSSIEPFKYSIKKGLSTYHFDITENLTPGHYSLTLLISDYLTGTTFVWIENYYDFSVKKQSEDGKYEYPGNVIHGYSLQTNRLIEN